MATKEGDDMTENKDDGLRTLYIDGNIIDVFDMEIPVKVELVGPHSAATIEVVFKDGKLVCYVSGMETKHVG